MAARREIIQRKAALLEDLRSSHREGQLVQGDLAPSVRDLARQYELSVGVVAQQMQVLVKEGLFYSVAGAGTFVGQRSGGETPLYLFLLAHSLWDNEIKAGFEDEVARRGGGTLVMTPDRVLAHLQSGNLPPVSGVFAYGARPLDRVMERLNEGRQQLLPEVNYADRSEDFSYSDRVEFDNFNGGRIATCHLQQLGHQRIAFLGAHAPHYVEGAEWSQDRLKGWQTALERAGSSATGLAFLPRRLATHAAPGSAQLFFETAMDLLQHSDASAVVTANDAAAQQLMAACRQLALPALRWPAVVSFDDTLSQDSQIITSLRLPWAELGRAAAALLWERTHGQLVGEPVCRKLPMRIIPRLTCRANWSLVENLQLAG